MASLPGYFQFALLPVDVERLYTRLLTQLEGNRWTDQIFDQADIVEIACNGVRMVLYEDTGLPPR